MRAASGRAYRRSSHSGPELECAHPDMADVFISYAREDFASARVLADRLTAAGCSVWWDPEIRFGEDYTAVITRELAAALCVVVLWSRHSVQSDWVLDEAQRASGRLIPIRLDNAEVPLGFGRIQSATLLEGVIPEQCVAVIKTFARTYSKRRRLKSRAHEPTNRRATSARFSGRSTSSTRRIARLSC